jgi:streptomycin 6-kinase
MTIEAAFNARNIDLAFTTANYAAARGLDIAKGSSIASPAGLRTRCVDEDGQESLIKVIAAGRPEQNYPQLEHHFVQAGILVPVLDQEQMQDGTQVQLLPWIASDNMSLRDMAIQSPEGDEKATRIICDLAKKIFDVPWGSIDLSVYPTFDYRLVPIVKHLADKNLPLLLREVFEKAGTVQSELTHQFAHDFVLGHGHNHHFHVLENGESGQYLMVDATGYWAPKIAQMSTLGFNPYNPLDANDPKLALDEDRMVRQCNILSDEFGWEVEDVAKAVWLNCIHVAARRYGGQTVANQAGDEYFRQVAKIADGLAGINCPDEYYNLPNFVAPK